MNNSPINTVGGTAAGAGNVISGNSQGGVAIYGSNAVNNVVQGNVIGLEVPTVGSAALANGQSGVYVGAGSAFSITSGTASGVATNTTIGDTTALGSNTIAANGGYGIWLASGTIGDAIQGNNIGTDTTGSVLRDNNQAAIQIDSGSAQSSAGTLVVDGSITGGGTFIVASGGTLSAASATNGVLSIAPALFTNNGSLQAASGKTLTIGAYQLGQQRDDHRQQRHRQPGWDVYHDGHRQLRGKRHDGQPDRNSDQHRRRPEPQSR